MGIITHKAYRLLLLLIMVLPTYQETPRFGSISDNSTDTSNDNTNDIENLQNDQKHISKLLSAQHVTVLVVGGGVSGLSTMETLLNNGVDDVLLLEATSRIGGRIRTIRRDGVLVEAGAEWIHGDQHNPVYKIANTLDAVGKKMPDEEWEWLLGTDNAEVQDKKNISNVREQSIDNYENEAISNWDLMKQLVADAKGDGVLIPYYNTSYGQYFIYKFHETFGDTANSTEGRALLHALEEIVNSSEGTDNWLDVSTHDADAWMSYGEDHQWKDGYDTLITHILSKIPSFKIKLLSPVSEVYWDQDSYDGVLVVTSSGRSVLAQHVVFTTSVAYLQKNHQNIFSPSLPKHYINALEGIRLGVADKIQIGWDAPWWSNTSKPFSVGILWENMDLPKEMSWLYGVVEVSTLYQQPTVLQMFVTGNNAKIMERLAENQVKTHVMYMLERIIKKSVPPPIFFNRSRWGSHPWTLGSYSSCITLAGEKRGLHSREPLSKSLYNSRGKMVLGWAGEHTHNTRHSCVDGALQTGIREANKIITLIKTVDDERRSAAMSLFAASTITSFVILPIVAVFVL